MGLLDTIAPTPRNKLLGLLADAAQGVSDFAAKPFGYNNPPGELVAGLLGVPDIAKTLDRLSYGEPLTTGTGMTLRPREEAVNAAMAALPLGATLGKRAIDAGVYAAQKAAPVVERAVPRIMESGGLPAEILRGMSQQTVSPLTVWHGSPHKFDKFDASKIGTGEGAQAYGHGLYVAESPDVAKNYQAALGRPDGAGLTKAQDIAAWAHSQGIDGAKPADILSSEIARLENYGKFGKRLNRADYDEAMQILQKGQAPTNGALYKVDLPDEHIAKMLDWDKPLSEQHPDVQKAIAKTKSMLPPNAAEDLGGDLSLMYGKDVMPQDFLNTWESFGQRNGAESALQKLGIPGIRYLDGGSRGTGAGTSNFVVFPGNEEILKILERNGKPVGLLGN